MAEPVQALVDKLEGEGIEFDVVTHKDAGKLLDCVGCGKTIIANAFAAAAKAQCLGCSGRSSVQQKPAASTRVTNLADKIMNPHFALALCPIDAEHDMFLVSVTHSENYGPNVKTGYDAQGRPTYKQRGPGETVIHQCKDCKAVVSYSTMHQVLYVPQDKVKQNKSEQLPGIVLRRYHGIQHEDVFIPND